MFYPRKLAEFSFIIGEKSQRESDWSVCMAVFRSICGLLEVVLTFVSLINSQSHTYIEFIWTWFTLLHSFYTEGSTSGH